MKKTISIAFALFLLFHIIQAQHKEAAYPGPTQYATSLYIADAMQKEGNMQRLADHFQVTGSGQLQWRHQVTESGEYEVVLSYATHQNGASVKVIFSTDTIRSSLPPTQGVYAEHNEWYQFNCERKLLKGKLKLSSGLNTILLQVNAPTDDFKTVIYALELMPMAKKADAMEEANKAQKVRPAMDGFSSMKYGVMFHWTSQTVPRTGNPKTYKEAVQSFDVQRFAKMVEETGPCYHQCADLSGGYHQ